MRLRKILALGAAAAAATALVLIPTAQASTPTGGPIAYVKVDGNSTNGSVAFTGTFKSGTASFGPGTFGCSGGSVAGTIQRGSGTTRGNMAFNSLSIICSTPVGGNATISLLTNTGCVTSTFLPGTNVHDGLVDTGTGTKFHRVGGIVTMPTTSCVRVSALGGLCRADVQGNAGIFFDEAQKSPSLAQDLVLNGPGLSLQNQAGCLGLLSGPITLNNVTFNISTPSPTSGVGGIDFRRTA